MRILLFSTISINTKYRQIKKWRQCQRSTMSAMMEIMHRQRPRLELGTRRIRHYFLLLIFEILILI